MKNVALITCDNLSGFVTDEHYLEKALKKRGFTFEWVPWRETPDWNSFDCAIVRTAWDYAVSVEQFLEKMKEIEKHSCLLINSFPIIQWNATKTYLKDLEQAGVPIVPTLWVRISELNEIQNLFEELDEDKIVIKPQVGAGGVDTFLLNRYQKYSEMSDIGNVLNRGMMVQPYLESVVREGEYSAHFFGGEFSHMILKTPRSGEFRSQEEYGSTIMTIDPEPGQLKFAEDVLSKVPGSFFFARVDFVYDSHGGERLMELELIEPSLYFRMQEGSADFFVNKLIQIL